MATIDENGNIIVNDSQKLNEESEIDSSVAEEECTSHEWEFKKQFKECLICSKRENYIDDPLETHVHMWSNGLILDKPKLSVCTKCGETKFNFNCEDAGDEGFFDFTSDYNLDTIKTVEKTTSKVIHLPKFKNKLPKKQEEKTEQIPTVPNNSPVKPVGSLFLTWKLNNPEKLSFIRR